LMNIEWRKEVWWEVWTPREGFLFFRNFRFHRYELILQNIWKSMEKIGRWIHMPHRLFRLKLNFKNRISFEFFFFVCSCVFVVFSLNPSIHLENFKF
jgi:hypothetical protein